LQYRDICAIGGSASRVAAIPQQMPEQQGRREVSLKNSALIGEL